MRAIAFIVQILQMKSRSDIKWKDIVSKTKQAITSTI